MTEVLSGALETEAVSVCEGDGTWSVAVDCGLGSLLDPDVGRPEFHWIGKVKGIGSGSVAACKAVDEYGGCAEVVNCDGGGVAPMARSLGGQMRFVWATVDIVLTVLRRCVGSVWCVRCFAVFVRWLFRPMMFCCVFRVRVLCILGVCRWCVLWCR